MPTDTRMPHFVAGSDLETVDVLGADVQFIPLPSEVSEHFCLMRGTIPAGASVPLHHHPSYETFTVISGAFEAFLADDDQPAWRPVKAGDVLSIPGGARHAFRNQSEITAVVFVFAIAEHGNFFREVSRPVGVGEGRSAPPAPERIAHFVTTAARAGYWLGTPEENARIGLSTRATA